MPSAAERPRDPGLAAERTALAWQRMALGFTTLAAVTLAGAAHGHAPGLVLPAAGLFAIAAAVWLHARRRVGDPQTPTTGRPLALLAAAAAAAALVAAVMAVARPGCPPAPASWPGRAAAFAGGRVDRVGSGPDVL